MKSNLPVLFTPGPVRIQFVINEPQEGDQPFLAGLLNTTTHYRIDWAQVPTSWDVTNSGEEVGSSIYTLRAVEGLRRFQRPTLVVWAADDRYISPSWGRKLFEEIPGALRFELVPFCGHFWQEERPSEFASIIGEFLSRHASAASEPAVSLAGESHA